MLKTILFVSLSAFALAACSPAPQNTSPAPAASAMATPVSSMPANWEATQTSLTFLSSKINQQLNSVTEQSQFTSSHAMLDKQGNFKMMVDLNSVQTNIEIRDQRIKDWVFQTAQFAMAEITGKVDMNVIHQLQLGESISFKQPLMLHIHGKELPIEAHLSAQRTQADKIMVSTLSPVVLDTKAMDMSQGVMQLVEVMGLKTIVEQIPVSFHAEFMRKE